MSSGAHVRIEWVRSPDALDRVAADWRALEEAVHTRTHLPTFDFLGTWYRHYAGPYGGTPLVGLAWRGPRLVGVAPFTVRRGRMGRIPIRRVELAPSDSPAGELLIEDGRPEIAAAFLDALAQAAAFDVICLDGFDPASDQLLALRDAARARAMAIADDDHALALVDLRAGYDAYRAGLGGEYRRKLNQKGRWIAGAGGATIGGVVFGRGDACAIPTLENATARMIAITEASYKLQGQRLADHHRGFLSELVARFGRRGMLSLSILSIGGRDAAFVLGVVERGCFYDVSLAYDESFARLSPGAFLMQKTLDALARAGVHTVISHGAHEYKRHWATALVPQTRLLLFAPTLRASATRFVRFRLQPLWRRLAVSNTPRPQPRPSL